MYSEMTGIFNIILVLYFSHTLSWNFYLVILELIRVSIMVKVMLCNMSLDLVSQDHYS